MREVARPINYRKKYNAAGGAWASQSEGTPPRHLLRKWRGTPFSAADLDIGPLRKLTLLVGIIKNNKGHNAVTYTVTKLSDLVNIIIPHFNKYFLISQKRADFILLDKNVFTLEQHKIHTASVLHTYIDGNLVFSRTKDE